METLYFGGNIITMENCNNPEAVLVREDEIAYVGDLKQGEKLCDEKCLKVNLNGKTMMPGFVDAHSHFSQVAQSIFACDLSMAGSFSDIKNNLKKYVSENQINTEGIVIAFGYDHNFLEEQMHPNRELLDEVSDIIPIFIMHISGHMGVANSTLLELAKIPNNIPNPEGGKFGRDDSGNLNGYVEEIPALMPVLGSVLARLKIDPVKQFQAAQELYLQNGITTVQEGAAVSQGMQQLIFFSQTEKLKLDIVVYIMAEDYANAVAEFPEHINKYKDRIKIGGAKLILDGSPQGKSAWLTTPYENEKEYCGYPIHTDMEVERILLDSIKGNYQILAHCNGDAAAQQFINEYKKSLSMTSDAGTDLRPVMIHCQTVRDDQLDEMKKLRIIPSIFIGHVYYWGDVHLKNLGSVRGNHISPVKSALDRGLIYNFHQDAPVTKPNMLHSVWCAVNRLSKGGRSIGEDQCIGVYDALKGVTINAAYEYHEEDQKGSIKEGKKADLIILDNNPLEVDKLKIKDIRVMETIKSGETVFRH
jgi:predicted amidohydrolase YtcJ